MIYLWHMLYESHQSLDSFSFLSLLFIRAAVKDGCLIDLLVRVNTYTPSARKMRNGINNIIVFAGGGIHTFHYPLNDTLV